MHTERDIWTDPLAHLRKHQPDIPILYFCPAVLAQVAARFQRGFDGLVTYAVKANDAPQVLDNLVATGMRAFDVASPPEMHAVRSALPDAVLHFNNPVRSMLEIETGKSMGVASWSVDRVTELEKLGPLAPDTEIAVRLKLPVRGAAYDFGEKFGATPDEAVDLLRQVQERGAIASMSFHPGTQCDAPEAWDRYINACAEVAQRAGVKLERLNVGGGFAAHRCGIAPDLETVFETISLATDRAFGPQKPELVCEPGRAMVAESHLLALRVKAVSADGAVTLNDGLYGTLMEWGDLPPSTRLSVVDPNGHSRQGQPVARKVFGPTCDSLDQLPDAIALPSDMRDGDYVLIRAMGAYTSGLTTRFNGYGDVHAVTVACFPSNPLDSA